MSDPVVWLCIHGDRLDDCLQCDVEDRIVNGIAEAVQCEHEHLEDVWCLDCGVFVGGDVGVESDESAPERYQKLPWFPE